MSLPKKDLRTQVKPEVHAALRIFAKRLGVTIERYVEHVISGHVVREAQDAIVLADEFQAAGIDRNFRESSFDSGLEHR